MRANHSFASLHICNECTLLHIFNACMHAHLQCMHACTFAMHAQPFHFRFAMDGKLLHNRNECKVAAHLQCMHICNACTFAMHAHVAAQLVSCLRQLAYRCMSKRLFVVITHSLHAPILKRRR